MINKAYLAKFFKHINFDEYSNDAIDFISILLVFNPSIVKFDKNYIDFEMFDILMSELQSYMPIDCKILFG